MTQYIKKSFDHAWQAAKFVEEGGKLFENSYSESFNPVESHGEACELFVYGIPFYTIKPKDWRDKLDGAVENGVLCFVHDYEEVIPGELAVVVRKEECYYTQYDTPWDCAKPLTRAEISKFMESAPE